MKYVVGVIQIMFAWGFNYIEFNSFVECAQIHSEVCQRSEISHSCLVMYMGGKSLFHILLL
jgi:hypothetical protein